MNNTLLTKLTKRMKLDDSTMRSFLKNAVKAISITTATAVLALSLNACEFIPGVDIPTDNSTINGIEGGPNNNTNIPTGPITPENSGYSALLCSVLNDSEVNALIDAFNADPSSVAKSQYEPHPYAFLESQGHDVSKIKSGELECHTVTYTCDDEPNSLYMITYVEDEGGRVSYDYCAEYHLKYTLTDQEMSEYQMLFGGRYHQAYFINDAISEYKTAEILSQSYMNLEAHPAFPEAFQRHENVIGKSYLNSENLGVLMQDFDADSRTCNVLVYTTSRNTLSASHDGKIAEVPLKTTLLQSDNGVYTSPCTAGLIKVNADKMDEYQASIKDVTIYDTSYASMWLQDLLTDN